MLKDVFPLMSLNLILITCLQKLNNRVFYEHLMLNKNNHCNQSKIAIFFECENSLYYEMINMHLLTLLSSNLFQILENWSE